MRKTEFTPGPWRTDEFDSRVLATPKGFIPTRTHPDFTVAQTAVYCGPFRSDEERQANARLIAVAPELYDELNVALAVIRSPESFYVEQICERIDNLLSKVQVPRPTTEKAGA